MSIYKLIIIILFFAIIIYLFFYLFFYYDKKENYVIDQKMDSSQILKNDLIHMFNQYLQNSKYDWNYVVPEEFNKIDKSQIFILDIRKSEDYKKGHIEGSINIFWLDLMKPENLKKLPIDKEIIIVCYVGHTASQILVLLKLLGYKARVLKFGMGQSPTVGIPVAGWSNYGFKIVSS